MGLASLNMSQFFPNFWVQKKGLKTQAVNLVEVPAIGQQKIILSSRVGGVQSEKNAEPLCWPTHPTT